MFPSTLAVRVQPGARKNQVVGYSEGLLRVKIAAPPVEGKANEGLVDYLAELLQIKPRQISVIKGAKSRQKLINVDGLEQSELAARLTALLIP